MKIHTKLNKQERQDRIDGVELVGLPVDLKRMPRNIGAASVSWYLCDIGLKSGVIILDEPTSALDVSVQARLSAL